MKLAAKFDLMQMNYISSLVFSRLQHVVIVLLRGTIIHVVIFSNEALYIISIELDLQISSFHFQLCDFSCLILIRLNLGIFPMPEIVRYNKSESVCS